LCDSGTTLIGGLFKNINARPFGPCQLFGGSVMVESVQDSGVCPAGVPHSWKFLNGQRFVRAGVIAVITTLPIAQSIRERAAIAA